MDYQIGLVRITKQFLQDRMAVSITKDIFNIPRILGTFSFDRNLQKWGIYCFLFQLVLALSFIQFVFNPQFGRIVVPEGYVMNWSGLIIQGVFGYFAVFSCLLANSIFLFRVTLRPDRVTQLLNDINLMVNRCNNLSAMWRLRTVHIYLLLLSLFLVTTSHLPPMKFNFVNVHYHK